MLSSGILFDTNDYTEPMDLCSQLVRKSSQVSEFRFHALPITVISKIALHLCHNLSFPNFGEDSKSEF